MDVLPHLRPASCASSTFPYVQSTTEFPTELLTSKVCQYTPSRSGVLLAAVYTRLQGGQQRGPVSFRAGTLLAPRFGPALPRPQQLLKLCGGRLVLLPHSRHLRRPRLCGGLCLGLRVRRALRSQPPTPISWSLSWGGTSGC